MAKSFDKLAAMRSDAMKQSGKDSQANITHQQSVLTQLVTRTMGAIRKIVLQTSPRQWTPKSFAQFIGLETTHGLSIVSPYKEAFTDRELQELQHIIDVRRATWVSTL
jgi:hypothetical protein